MNNPTITNLISALRSETATGAITPESLGSLLQKIVDEVPEEITAQNKASNPLYHIEATSEADILFIKGDVQSLLSNGYIPYLFRYSVKRNRHRSQDDSKFHGPKRKGWNPFFRSGKISVDTNGLVKIFGNSDGHIDLSTNGTSPILLFSNFITLRDEETGEVQHLRVPFGSRMVDCRKGHRFKFAIGFAPTQLYNTFDFSTLITNLAIFHVKIKYNPDTDEIECHFAI